MFEKDMNAEIQLQAAYAMNAQLRDQIDSLNRTVWSLEERLRISDESREDLKRFYENQMDALRADQQKLIDAAVAQITKSFEEQISKLIAERDAALLSARRWRGKKYGRGSERNAGRKDDENSDAGENRESEKADFVSPEDQARKDAGKTSATTSKRCSPFMMTAKRAQRRLWPPRSTSVLNTRCRCIVASISASSTLAAFMVSILTTRPCSQPPSARSTPSKFRSIPRLAEQVALLAPPSA